MRAMRQGTVLCLPGFAKLRLSALSMYNMHNAIYGFDQVSQMLITESLKRRIKIYDYRGY